jgi:hypothetical protein
MSSKSESFALRSISGASAVSPFAVRSAFIIVCFIAFGIGFLATPPQISASLAQHAGADLTRLLRAMAAIKMLLAACATAAMFWRLGVVVTLPWFASYAITAAAIWAGPGLIWGMSHVGLGALLLHGGLLASILLLWRDPAMAQRLETIIAERRAAIARRALTG